MKHTNNANLRRKMYEKLVNESKEDTIVYLYILDRRSEKIYIKPINPKCDNGQTHMLGHEEGIAYRGYVWLRKRDDLKAKESLIEEQVFKIGCLEEELNERKRLIEVIKKELPADN